MSEEYESCVQFESCEDARAAMKAERDDLRARLEAAERIAQEARVEAGEIRLILETTEVHAGRFKAALEAAERERAEAEAGAKVVRQELDKQAKIAISLGARLEAAERYILTREISEGQLAERLEQVTKERDNLKSEVESQAAQIVALTEGLQRVIGYANRGIEGCRSRQEDASDFIRIAESVKHELAALEKAKEGEPE